MTEVDRIAILLPLATGAIAVVAAILIHALALRATVNFVRYEKRLGQFGVSAAIVFAVIQRLIQARFADLQGPPTFSKQMLVWEKLPRFAHCHKRTGFRRLDRWKQKTVSLAAANGLADGNWSTPTHLGYEYAALLVDPGFRPPPTMDVAPAEGGSVAEVRIVKGVGSLPPASTKSLHFSGYDWNVRTISADRGGVNNLFDGDNAWTDTRGALHLRITRKADRWWCAQLVLARSLGYGTYIVVVRDTSHLEPAAVLSMHTFDESGGNQHYREMDVEISRWGDATNRSNVQYGIQPFYVPGNVVPFTEPSGTLTHTLRWESGRASFATVRGSSAHPGAPAVFRHVFTSGVPSPGQEVFQLMLYVVASDRYPLQKETEVVVEKFEYFP